MGHELVFDGCDFFDKARILGAQLGVAQLHRVFLHLEINHPFLLLLAALGCGNAIALQVLGALGYVFLFCRGASPRGLSFRRRGLSLALLSRALLLGFLGLQLDGDGCLLLLGARLTC